MLSGLLVSGVLLATLFLPGWAIIALTGVGAGWRALLRWCLALAAGIAFYPVVFYAARFVLPSFRFGRIELFALLALSLLLVVWRLRKSWRDLFRFDLYDVLAIAVFGAILFTRFWIIRDQPYPAWSDSFHHTLLTQLTAQAGQLPARLEPYSPTPLDMYHLGLYALSAVPAILLGTPAHTALLGAAQTLNALAGLGVFLLLDLKVGRTAGLVGLVTAGLLSHQPAFYVNWGRFTQAASQSILLVAFLITWETLRAWRPAEVRPPGRLIAWAALAGLLNAGVFLLHFRVAIFYFALIAPVLVWEFALALKARRLPQLLASAFAVGALSALLAAPAIAPAAITHLGRAAQEVAADNASGSSEIYHAISWEAVPFLVARPWLLAVALCASVFGLLRRNRIVALALTWTALLVAIGSASRLGIPALDVTNLSGVMIGFYLPLSLVIGAAAEELARSAPAARRRQVATAILSVALLAGFVMSHARVADVELYRYFVTPDDVEAMAWIEANTPADAIFAINTYFWLPDSPHGTDAGYWIPYFTGRRTTASSMLFPLSPVAYRDEIVRLSRAADQLDLDALRREGVRYIYSGARGDFAGVGLRPEILATVPDLELLHEFGGASVWEIKGAGG